jgi:hypothetical protein
VKRHGSPFQHQHNKLILNIKHKIKQGVAPLT